MTLLQERLPDFPEHPGDGFQIQEPLPDGGFVMWTYNEQFNQWTYETFSEAISGFIYTDQVRTRNEAKPANIGEDEEPVLQTQKDVNHFLADNLGGGGDSDLEALEERVADLEALFHPWVDVDKLEILHQFDFIYWQPHFSCHDQAEYNWEYQICLDARNNPDDWVDPSTLDSTTKAKIGWNFENVNCTQLNKTDEQHLEFPYAKCRFHVMTELNGWTDEGYSCELPAWDSDTCWTNARSSRTGKRGKGSPVYEQA